MSNLRFLSRPRARVKERTGRPVNPGVDLVVPNPNLGPALAIGTSPGATNWTDNGGNRFTHTAGSATPLTIPVTGLVADEVYEIAFTPSGLTQVASSDTVTVGLYGSTSILYHSTRWNRRQAAWARGPASPAGITINIASSFAGSVTIHEIRKVLKPAGYTVPTPVKLSTSSLALDAFSLRLRADTHDPFPTTADLVIDNSNYSSNGQFGSDIGVTGAAEALGATTTSATAASTLATAGQTLSITIGPLSKVFTFQTSGGTSGTTIDLSAAATDTVGEVLDYMESVLDPGDDPSRPNQNNVVGISLQVTNGRIQLLAGDTVNSIVIVDGTSGFGFGSGTSSPSPTKSVLVKDLSKADRTKFIKAKDLYQLFLDNLTITNTGAASGDGYFAAVGSVSPPKDALGDFHPVGSVSDLVSGTRARGLRVAPGWPSNNGDYDSGAGGGAGGGNSDGFNFESRCAPLHVVDADLSGFLDAIFDAKAVLFACHFETGICHRVFRGHDDPDDGDLRLYGVLYLAGGVVGTGFDQIIQLQGTGSRVYFGPNVLIKGEIFWNAVDLDTAYDIDVGQDGSTLNQVTFSNTYAPFADAKSRMDCTHTTIELKEGAGSYVDLTPDRLKPPIPAGDLSFDFTSLGALGFSSGAACTCRVRHWFGAEYAELTFAITLGENMPTYGSDVIPDSSTGVTMDTGWAFDGTNWTFTGGVNSRNLLFFTSSGFGAADGETWRLMFEPTAFSAGGVKVDITGGASTINLGTFTTTGVKTLEFTANAAGNKLRFQSASGLNGFSMKNVTLQKRTN